MRAIYILCARQLKRYVRSPARIIGSLGQPILFLVALGFGFGSMFAKAGGGSYLNFLAPGGSLRIDRVEALEIIAFIIVAATVTTTMEALQRARKLAESRASELKRVNEEVGRSLSEKRPPA